jgi:hypothetical protein
MNRLRNIEWEAVAGIAAAVVALVLHLLSVVEQDVLLTIVLVILAIMLLQNLRRDAREQNADDIARATHAAVERLRDAVAEPELRLVGPAGLRQESTRFAAEARGRMVWFNTCLLMFEPQVLFDTLLRPAIENPRVESIEFILDGSEQQRWAESVLPKIRNCSGAAKVAEPRWTKLEEAISFVVTETEPTGAVEAHLSFWGEPFMARSRTRDVPRYIFRVYGNSELIPRLLDMERQYRLKRD